MGVGAATLVVIVWRVQSRQMITLVPFEEDDEELREQVRQAFKDRQPPVDDEIARQVKAVLDQLGAALRTGNPGPIMARFDLDRMLDELAAVSGGAAPRRNTKERWEFRRGFAQSFGVTLAQRGQMFNWDETDIRTVKKLNNDEAVIITRHKHPNGASLKMRWWVTRRNGDWQIYDFEDLDWASRISTEMVALLGQGLGQAVEIGRAFRTIAEALHAIAQRDLDRAEQKLAQVRGVQLPPRFESPRQLANGLVLLHRHQNAEALKALEEAHRLQPDFPVADFLRGVALNRLGKPDQALKHLQAYRDLLGEDAEVCREIGEGLCELHRFDDAAKEYRKALDFNPKEDDAFLGLLRSLGGDSNLDDVGPRFAKLDNLYANFDVCAEDCERREFPELLDPIVQAMRKIDPDYPPVDYYQALVYAQTGRPDEAVRSLESSLRKEKDKQKQQEYRQHFLKAMASGGHYSQAYTAATSPREAFRFLAGEAVKRYRTDALKKLVAAHAQKDASDPVLALCRAEIYVRDGKYALADKGFANALAHRPDAETLQSFRASRVLARYHTGQVMSAYRDIQPREETFAQLASLLFEDEKDDQLQELLNAHARDAPDSIETDRFRYRLLIHQNKTAEGIALFKTALAKSSVKEKRSELVSEFLSDMVAEGKLLEGYQSAPDAREAFRQLADDLIGDWDDLRRLLDAHRAGNAEDPWLAYYQAEAHLHEQAWEKAAKVLAEEWKRNPKDARDAIRGDYVFALYKAGHWQQAYAEIEPHKETFTQLANLLANDRKGSELEALVRLHRPNAGDNLDLTFYEMRAKALTKKWAEAASLLRQASQNQTKEFERANSQTYFLLDLAAEERWLEGYRAAVDKTAAFDTLAAQLLTQKKDKDLAALLEEHHKNGAGEPWYSFYQGELFLLRGDAQQAASRFATALSKAKSQDEWRLRNGLFRAQVQAGRAALAYTEHKADEATFASLAQLCMQNKDAKQLQGVIDAYRKDTPDDPNLVSWEMELMWLRKDYEGALRLLTEHREDVFTQSMFRWKADNYRVRCLVKLKRNDEAVRAAEKIVKKRSGDRLLLVLAHAAAGDVPQTIAAVGKRGTKAYLLPRCYDDDDLGPILKSKEFDAFRAKFPEPKRDKAAENWPEA
jgi:tetratricopeptide (TPR) repeat protein